MDYLVGIFLLLCGVALPGRVAPQHTKDNVPRLKLSYKVSLTLLHKIYTHFALTDCFHVVFLHVLALLHNFSSTLSYSSKLCTGCTLSYGL
ncbi:Semaphorin-3aa [Anabarilius grahami]|uniref:Semaphorin-3aa n=1 Tax=Anabarilius grahami TaxID=495550 RepID=A0A3N0XD94_ANAGA|nr:Semaphorin-3aa [Anabarilius grahami]